MTHCYYQRGMPLIRNFTSYHQDVEHVMPQGNTGLVGSYHSLVSPMAVSYVGNLTTTINFQICSTSNHREDAISSSNQHNYSDTER